MSLRTAKPLEGWGKVSNQEGRKVETGMSLDGWRKQATWERR